METLYLEYRIVSNRPGLLGDIASLLGLLKINIVTIASIEGGCRGLLIEIKDLKTKMTLEDTIKAMDELKICCLRQPNLFDFLALKHGKRIQAVNNNKHFHFKRTDLHLLIDFLSEYIKANPTSLIGFDGEPGIGKTETIIAASVHARKHWQLLSSTLLRKIARSRISEDSINTDTVFIIDSITTFRRAPAEHVRFIKKFINNPIPRVVEHPAVFIEATDFNEGDFDLFVELNDQNKEVENSFDPTSQHSFNSFDIS